LILAFIIVAGIVTHPDVVSVSDEKYAGMHGALDEFTPTIKEDMNEIFSLTEATARNLSGVSMGDSSVELALLQLRRDIPASYDTYIVDTNNTIQAITGTSEEQKSVGTQSCANITEEDLKSSKNTSIVTSFYTFNDGKQGIIVISPIYSSNGTYTGTLRVSLDTAYLFSGAVDQLRSDYGYTIWSIQQDGCLIYYEDTELLGKNTLNNEIYTEESSFNVAQLVTEKPEGNISYVFYNVGWVEKGLINAVWDTISFPDGTEWRIVLTDDISMNNIDIDNEHSSSQFTTSELRTFVEKAYVYAQTHTKEEALKAFNDRNGEFINGELYIFAYDINGTTLALPYQTQLVGINRLQAEDITGVKFVQREIARTEQGGGYVYCQYPNPAKGFARELKFAYVMPINNNWFIGAGLYMDNTSFEPCGDMRNKMISQVRNFQYLSKIMPEDELISMLNNPNSSIQVDGLYPFASTYSGTILSYVMDPSVIGNNHLGYVNSYGMSIGREAIPLAQSGGGLIYSLVWDPELERDVYVLIYVEPVTEDTYYGSMIILE
jgi:hypothetical protein